MSGKLLALSPALDFDNLDDSSLIFESNTKSKIRGTDGKNIENSLKRSTPTKASAYKKKE